MDIAFALNEIQSDLRALEDNDALRLEINFNDRAAAIDFLEVHVLDRLEILCAGRHPLNDITELLTRAKKLQEDFEQTDLALWTKLRRHIKASGCPPAAFRAMILTYTGYDSSVAIKSSTPGYDNLDLFINGLCAQGPVPEPCRPLTPDMVGYQKTPAHILFELADLARPTEKDVFIDLGSGLGQAAILFHLLTGVRCAGIDIEPAYHRYATASAAGLQLDKVSFENKDVRTAALTDGTIFFLYTPFRASMLEEVLALLHRQSKQRRIRIFTYGPCSAPVCKEQWLRSQHASADNPDTLYSFHSY